MNVREKLLAQLLCKLMQILPAVLGHWPRFPGEELKIPKALMVSESDPVAKFTLGPFESLNDEFYRSSKYITVVNSNSKEMQEEFTELKEKSYQKQRQTEKKEVEQFQKHYNGNPNRSNNKKEISIENQLLIEEKMLKREEVSSKPLKDIQEKLKGIKKDIGELPILTETLWKIKEDLKNFSSDLCDKLLQNLLRSLKTSSRKSSKEKNKGEIPNEYRSLNKHGFKSMNNITYNNRYQIGNIFIFNRLSGEKKNSISKFNEYEEPENEIFHKSTESNIKALSSKNMNNLKDEPNSETSYESFSEADSTPQSLRTRPELAFIKELKAKFSKIFLSGNVTLEQINRMSKVVDFVERYHGIINDSKYLGDFNEIEKIVNKNTESFGHEKEYGSFAGERTNEKTVYEQGDTP